MSEIILREAAQYSLILSKAIEPGLSWGNSPLTVCTDTGLYIYKFEHNVVTYTRGLRLTSKSFLTPKHMPCKSLFVGLFENENVCNQDLILCRIDPNLWAHNEKVAAQNMHFQTWHWLQSNNIYSPPLATLTNTGSVDIFIESRTDFTNLINLSSILEEQYTAEGVISDLNDIVTLGNVSRKVLSSALCWGVTNHDSEHYLVTAQKNGDIIFWKIKCMRQNNEISATLNSKLELVDEEIIQIKWIWEDKDNFFLIYSLLHGKVVGHYFKIVDNVIGSIRKHILWDYDDKMPAKFIEYFKSNNNHVLIFTKHRHLIVQLLDKEYNLLDSYIKNLNDHRIIGLVNLNQKIVVGTFCCELFIVNIDICDLKLNIIIHKQELPDNYNKYYLNAFGVSQNNVFWALDVSDKTNDARRVIRKVKLNLLYNDINEINLLLNNSRQTLNNMSDCIELLKFKASKFKLLPKINYKALLYEGIGNIYKLKIYYILVTLYKNRLQYSSKKGGYKLPEMSVEKIRDTIFMRHSINLLKNICKIHQEVGELNDIQTEVYSACKYNLNDFCKKYEIKIETLFQDNLNIKCSFNYKCQCCDENLIGFSCKNNHLNQFCSVTFTPIMTDNYLVCNYCSLTAKHELLSENATCTICDMPLTPCD